MKKKKYTFLDLFAGAGGFSEGFIRAGFYPVAFIEMDRDACYTLKSRLSYDYLSMIGKENYYYDYLKGKITRDQFYSMVQEKILDKVINVEINQQTIKNIFNKIDSMADKNIDIIIGGPPCQAYSVIGRSRMKDDVKTDKRNHLFKFYIEFLEKYQPSIFIFENVPGLLSAEKGIYFEKMLDGFTKAGYNVKYKILNASDYGVLQNRKRIFIIGVRGKNNFEFPEPEKIKHQFKLKDLFKDLPAISSGEIYNVVNYINNGSEYLKKFFIRNGLEFTTQHITRPINEKDLQIYSIAIEKFLKTKKQLKYNELPTDLQTHKNKVSFLDRFRVLDIEGFSHSIVSHLSKDGHYYIYPDINNPRSISIREAARIQTFPDDYYFEGSRTSVFKQIGNAVPPLMAYALARKIKEEIL